jgi:HEAT repeat protein
MELHRRGTPDTFAKALASCKDGSGVERRVGAVVLAQLGYAEGYPFRLASIPILLRMLEDTDVSALEGAAHAFAYIACPDAVDPLVRLAEHPNADVRQSVVHGLGGQVSGHFPPEAVQALVRLSSDSEERDVRDWATFFLRDVAEAGMDTPAVRAAMWARMEDEDEEVRAEALEGLAVLGDTDVIPALQAAIRRGCERDWDYLTILRAAEALADETLRPALRDLRKCVASRDEDGRGSSWLKDIDDAIAACRGHSRTADGEAD